MILGCMGVLIGQVVQTTKYQGLMEEHEFSVHSPEIFMRFPLISKHKILQILDEVTLKAKRRFLICCGSVVIFSAFVTSLISLSYYS